MDPPIFLVDLRALRFYSETERKGFVFDERADRTAELARGSARIRAGPEGGVVKKLLGILSVLWLAVSAMASAQEPPPCPCPEPPPPPAPLWFGKVNFSFLSTSGNTDTTSIGGAAEVNYNPKPFLFTLKGAYLYSQTDGVVTAESSAASMRGNYDITERFYVFAGAGYLRNTFSGIDALWSIDGGAGYKLFDGPTQFLKAEGGVGWTNEKDIITINPLPPLPSVTTFVTRSYANVRAALNYKWQFTKTAYFTNDFTYLLDLDNTKNYFITDKAAITAEISKVFGLQASWTLLWRNQPVPGFGHTDTATAVGVVAAF
jgi:putative salt-induced outer membrane protein